MKQTNYLFENKKRTILIADDEFINREILGNLLQEDYDLIYAEDGVDCYDQMVKYKDKISLVLLDLIMPKMNGLELLEKVKQDPRLLNIPIIVVTSDSMSEEKSLSLGAADFLPKPYPRSTVISARINRTIMLYEDRKIIKHTERDNLTNLYNLEYFYHYGKLFDQFSKDDMDAIVLNIRHFHILNERLGTKFCNDLLKSSAIKIKEFMKKIKGIVCRRDADAFMIYCKHQDDYTSLLNELNDEDSGIIFKMGIYSNVDKSLDISIRFDRAKLAVDKIIENLTKNIEYYDDKLREKQLYEENLINDFKKAINNNEFKVYYQPKFNIRGDVPYLTSAEALVRWFHPELGMISPGVFIPLFEENGLIEQLDNYVWNSVGKQLKEWKDKFGFIVPISVNVSRIDMYDPNFINNISSIIKNNDITTDDILLEITESAYTEDSVQIIDIANKLKEFGFKIEMDDFGTGYSSLNMINVLPIDVLKLDMVFIKSAFKEKNDTKIIEFIIDIAKYLNVPVVAEGVETKEQVDSLKKLGCDIIQGYYFSKPIPNDEFESFIIKRKEMINNANN